MNTKRILHTWSAGLLVIGAMLLTLVGCMDDDLAKNNGDVVEGVPITVSLNLSGKASTDVTVETRASGSNYSWLSDVVICVFHGDGSFEQIVTNYGDNKSLEVDQYADSETDNYGNRRYKVSFKSTSGTKKLIAVANVADGGYWEGLVDLLKEVYDNEKSFDEVKKLIAGLNENILKQAASEDGVPPFSIASSSQMFMSGWNQNVEFKTDGSVTQGDYGSVIDNNNNVIAVQMYRSMAHITFNIAAAPERAKGIFTPTSYRVYNIPTKSYLMNDTQGDGVFALTSAISGVEEKIDYIHTASSIIGTAQGGNYSFNFYMPENVQEAGTNAITGEDTKQLYQLRDMWESQGNSGAAPENKDWTHAPDQSTFVVISGTYESKSTATDEDYIGNVEYTIHLGDFSATGFLNNFSVERNVSYTYNVQVLGVKNIVVEATTNNGEKQPGAEGSIYDRADTEYAYNLDAHYEQVFLEYNLSNIVAELKKQGLSDDELDEAIANQLVLVIQSEAMDHNSDGVVNKRGSLKPYEIYVNNSANPAQAKADILAGNMDGSSTPTKGFDYKWIEFWPQTGTDIAAYPGMSSWAREDLDGMVNSDFYEGDAQGHDEYLMDVYDVIVEMGKKVKELYLSTDNTLTVNSGAYPQAAGEIMITKNGNDYVARFTAFVNEYYYLRHPLTGTKVSMWSVMTNKIPREMIIAMSTKTSLDGNSSYSKIHSYISQLSMETFYSDRAEDSNLNAFGMETYNETPLTYYFGKDESTTNGLSDSDGRENQKVLISTTPQWSYYINSSGNGWTQSVGTDHANHKLTGAYRIQAAYSACMSRNRDLNGNGKIDENEIRWYLASLNEYIRMGIGANAISSAAKLFTGDKTAMKKGATATSSDGYPSAYIKDGSLYYTSSSSGKRVYWAIEKGSYGAINSGYDSSPLPIRCIRVLPSPSGKEGQDISSITGITSDATYEKLNDKGLTVLKFEGRLMSSLYRPTRVPDSLDPHNEDQEGANSFYRGIFVAGDYLKDREDNILGYTLSEITGNGSTMNNPCLDHEEGGYENWRVPNLVELSAMNAAGLLDDCDDVEYGRAASCTQFSNLDVRYGFARSTLIYCPGAKGNELSWRFRIRCVRDVPAGYTFPTN